MPAGEGLLQWWFDVEGRRIEPDETSVTAWLRHHFAAYVAPVAQRLGSGPTTLLGDAATCSHRRRRRMPTRRSRTRGCCMAHCGHSEICRPRYGGTSSTSGTGTARFPTGHQRGHERAGTPVRPPRRVPSARIDGRCGVRVCDSPVQRRPARRTLTALAGLDGIPFGRQVLAQQRFADRGRHAIAKLAYDTLQLHAGTAWKARLSNLLAERPHA